MHRTAKQIMNEVNKANKILLVPHQNPDGDAIGSVSACMQYLENIGKEAHAFCVTDVSPKLNYLAHTERISTDPSMLEKEKYDLIIVFDSGDLKYAGIEDHLTQIEELPVIVNIDHHVTNSNYGLHNLVMSNVSSTTEILFKFFTYNKVKLNKNMATALLTGIITDTDNFTNAATTTSAMRTASELVKLGGDIKLIKRTIYQDKTINSLKLWGTVLSRLSKHESLEIVHTYITQQDMEDHGVEESEIDGMANFMNNLSDGKAGMIMKETGDGKIKCSMRTTRDDYDVSKLAKMMGGGGHKKAAGFTIDGPMDGAIKLIFDKFGNSKQVD